MLFYYKVRFHNGNVKEYKAKSPIDDSPLFILNPCLLCRHINKGPIVQDILRGDRYFSDPDISNTSVIKYFKAKVLESRLLDGRTKETRGLPWFSMEEYIANY